MRPPPDAGQSHLLSRRGVLLLGFAGCAALGAAVWFLAGDPSPAPPQRESVSAPPVVATPALAAAPRAEPEMSPAPVAPVVVAASPPPETARPVSTAATELPLAMMEERFHAARAKEDRIELASEIAGRNDAEAVASLGRLFRFERHPEVKVALLGNLSDIDHDTAPVVRLKVLGEALRGQPRDVRTAALDSLAQLDDPQVKVLLRQAMASDPDREVRDIAAALYRARFVPEQ